jgi:aspartyl-tRNA(Asn)/glutamyl-tRNA(Gln) amidotransferase subunit A
MYLSDVFTIAQSLAGICALSLPCGFDGGLPVGLQITGPALGERIVLRVAHVYEQATGWRAARPKL